jgi:bacteriocin biosynthesis cyclodehydratase domain-containing protein
VRDFSSARQEGFEEVQRLAGDTKLVLCDDYLDSRISAVNAKALEDRFPFLLLKPSGPKIWVGPLIVPGDGACWQCLRYRLVENRWSDHQTWRDGGPVDTYIEELQADIAEKLLRSVSQCLLQFRASGTSPLQSCLCIIHTQSGREEQHPIVRRTHCPACREFGSPRLWTDAAPEASVYQRLMQQYSSVTGILSNLKNVSGDEWLPVHVASCDCTLPLDPREPLMGSPPEKCAGRGRSLSDAVLGCLAEGVERYSSFYQDGVAIRRDTLEGLGASALDPRTLCAPSAKEVWGPLDTSGDGLVPVSYDPSRPIDWVLAEGLGNSPAKWVPAAYVYLRHLEPGHTFCVSNSSGCAAGSTLESATSSALLELVEREALAIWWHHRNLRPRIRWQEFEGTWLEEIPELFRRQGLRVWLLDLTHDWNLPVVAAVCCQRDSGATLVGATCAPSFQQAAESAVTELIQVVIGTRRCTDHDVGLVVSQAPGRQIGEHPFVLGFESNGELPIHTEEIPWSGGEATTLGLSGESDARGYRDPGGTRCRTGNGVEASTQHQEP